MASRLKDEVLNGCIVGKVRKQWTWLCVGCGIGAIVDCRQVAEERAQRHECETSDTKLHVL